MVKITIDLTDYEASNLKNLLEWVAGRNQNLGIRTEDIANGVRHDPRISWFNNGDWVNQIRYKLPEYGYDHPPNGNIPNLKYTDATVGDPKHEIPWDEL